MTAIGLPASEFKKTITEGILQEAGDHSVEQLTQKENELLVGLNRLRAQQGNALGAEEHV